MKFDLKIFFKKKTKCITESLLIFLSETIKINYFFYLFINFINILLEILGLSVFLLLIVTLIDSNNGIQILDYFQFFKIILHIHFYFYYFYFFSKLCFKYFVYFIKKKLKLTFKKKIFLNYIKNICF